MVYCSLVALLLLVQPLHSTFTRNVADSPVNVVSQSIKGESES
jgi:hypothetical protein